ncbi:MAG TPA: choice-of-anchor tandem repeat GloVer-containing protein, partial [Verrucomicrobiae bacterium]|nr:choice-of-anchor tandem repeat GloVer-containing protein [Verrucomicrobiae bacterium]
MNPKTEFKSRWCGQFKNLLAVQVGVFLSLVAASVPAQTYTILHTFGTNTMGLNPYSQLVQGPDGALYGTTEGGGSANRGQVFKVNPDGSAYTVLKDFTGSDGVYADAGLVLSGTTLYGTTSGGGSNDNGTVFKVNTDGTGFSVLKQFTGYDGANPHAKLTLSGAVLYGTTGGGGAFGNGTVFKINTDGTDFAVLRHFTGNIDGGWLYACLVASGSTLYGTANGGGSYGNGTVFKVNTDGSGFTVLRSFTGGSDGGRPSAGLSISGTTLYGTASSGGNSGNGTLFRLNTDGSGFTVLKDFTYAIEGAYPYADLVLSGSTLYGTTVYGGSDNSGQVFMINTDGSGFSVLKDFTNSTDGVNPSAGLVLSGTTLYG